MYERTNKRRLYQLIKMFLAGKINESSFCDKFVPLYDVELDHDLLTEEENQAFCELSRIAGRFSEFKKDHKEHPGVFYTEEDVKHKVLEIKEKLNKYFNELRNEDTFPT